MKLSNYRIGLRLSFAFGIVVLISIASAGLALRSLSNIRGHLEEIVLTIDEKTKLTRDMSEATHELSESIRMLVLLSEKVDLERESQQLNAARDRYQQARSALEKFPTSPEGRANRTRIDEAGAKALPLMEKARDLALSNQDADAVKLLLQEVTPAARAWQEALAANVALQDKNTDAAHVATTQDYSRAQATFIAANVVGVLLALGLGWLITRSITLPMKQARTAAQRVADGDLTTEFRPDGKDETAELVRALASMRDNFVAIVKDVRANAEGVATASAEISQGNNDLSGRTEQQASALEETAASMEQLSSTVKQNADNASQANQLALNASEIATRGGEVVDEVVSTMKGINEGSRKIADIIAVIDGIAFQTNILALNAAVEAARAGEQGRGFAVVASEVRSLAQRSAQAAKEIKTLISSSVERVEHGSVLVDKAGETMTEVVASIRRVTDIMSEISAASREQSSGVSQVEAAVTQMDQATQQNAALVEQSAAAAESLRDQARRLVSVVEVFRTAA